MLWLASALIALVLVSAVVWTRLRAESNDPVLVAAGDIADCKSPGAAATAKLVEAIPNAVVATLGDNVYPGGAKKDFNNCYNTTWGKFKDRTYPAPGNHDYMQKNAGPYYEYFGAVAGGEGKGYYSYDVGTWHIIVLNSECAQVGGCKAGDPQEKWLKADLAAHPNQCTLAMWHHPIFGSSGSHTHNTFMEPAWTDLYTAGADLVLNGHAHNYERLAPLDPKGVVDTKRGIREFIAGTGGRDHRQFSKIFPASEVRNDDAFGVLKLTLHPSGYDWQFIPEAGKTFTDSGSGTCH